MKGKLLLVEIFKGIAILMVILVHSEQMFSLNNGIEHITSFGQMGCQIFFLMSSFTLCYSYKNDYLSFIKKRLRRIIPGYWTLIFLNFVLTFVCFYGLGIKLFTSVNPIDYVINLFLLNGLCPGAANNNVVLGGWFVGTIVILYILFPIIYGLYFYISNIKRRIWLFPLLTLFFSDLALYTIINIIGDDGLQNNSFLYFSFLNQLPVFVLGFSLYDIIREKQRIRFAHLKFIILSTLSVVLFFSGWNYAFMFVTFVFGLSMFYLYYILNKCNIGFKNKCINVILQFSHYSFPIYLTHSFIVYYGVLVFIKLMDTLGLYNATWCYVSSIPFIYLFIYLFIGKIFLYLCAESRVKVF